MPSRKHLQRNVTGMRKDLVKLLEKVAPSHGNRLDFFRDCMEMWAITISNQIAGGYKYQEREDRFRKIESKYTPEQITGIAHGLALFQIVTGDEGGDVLGDVYMGMNLGNENAGQFFTPMDVATAMAQVTIDPQLIEQKRSAGDLVTTIDPCVGAGAMLIAAIDHLDNEDVKFRDVMYFEGVDIDRTCVHMAYLQLCARGVMGLIRHGNSLSQEMWDEWCTPAYAFYLAQKKQPQEQPALAQAS